MSTTLSTLRNHNGANHNIGTNRITLEQSTLFPLGEIIVTPCALIALNESGQRAEEFTSRHCRGDWGEASQQCAWENMFSLKHGHKVMSVYQTKLKEKLILVTDADRSRTTLFLAEEEN